MDMEIYGVINTLISVILGGGWFIHWRASRRKANGEATQSEADGWKAMQELYQKTISDFQGYSEDMRKERAILKKENTEMYDKYKKLDEEIIQLKRRLSRQGRKIDALSPFLCSVVGCLNRKRVNINAWAEDNEQQNT
jgi:peptidoglycan hydrolase CwlO-like protein